MSHPQLEIKFCEVLLEKGIPACKFIPSKQGKMLSTDENGRRFTSIAEAIRSNMRIVEKMSAYGLDINKFGCGNTQYGRNISRI